jgi:type II secretory pathway pseudopilin PulG
MVLRRQLYPGFTLVELLIAVSLTSLIVVMLGIMFGSLLSTSSRASQRIDAFRDARAALQMIDRDLSGLVRNQRDSVGAPVTRPAAYFALKNIYADPGSISATANNQQIYALIAAKNSGLGDVCSVGYYCQWDKTKNAYNLCRFFHDSIATYNVFAAAAANYVTDSSLYTPAASDDVLASYVWDLRVTAYDSSGAVITPYPYVCDQSAASATPLPAAIEVAFKAMSQQAGRTMTSVSSNPNDWLDTATQNYQRLIKPNTYEFRTRIHFD